MPTFATPDPISVTVDIAYGEVQFLASDRTDTVVSVEPANPAKQGDVKAARQTRVEYSDGRLLVKGPRLRSPFIRDGGIEVIIELPTGSRVSGDAGAGDFRSSGELGLCRLKTSAGSVHLDQTGALDLTAGAGNIAVDRAVGSVEVSAGAGYVRIREIDGSALIKNSNGSTKLGEVTGEARVNSASGDISVGRVLTGINAKTAYGSIHIGEAVRGRVVLESGYGELEVGIRHGTAAWLDVHSKFGRVRNSMEAIDGTETGAETDESVEILARTGYGNILIQRSHPNSFA